MRWDILEQQQNNNDDNFGVEFLVQLGQTARWRDGWGDGWFHNHEQILRLETISNIRGMDPGGSMEVFFCFDELVFVLQFKKFGL
jgi:hypothetical protein